LESRVESLREQAAMLLSNLLTNEDVRKHLRYLSWCEPMSAILASGNQNSVCQVTRCIVNITFDEHCRYMCVKQGIGQKLKTAAARVRSADVDELCKTANSNLEVGVSGDIQKDVDNALRSGGITKVNAPTSNLKEQKKNDFDGLDDLLGASASNKTYSQPARNTTASKPSSSALDDLDSLLDGPSTKPKPTAPSPRRVDPPSNKNTLDDLDSLLDGPSSKPKAPTPTQRVESKPQAAPQPAKTQAAKPATFDDLDDLLSTLPPKQPTKPVPKKTDMDDIDSLLADVKTAPKKTAAKPHYDDDIDSLLADLGNNKAKPKGKQPSNEIDDLLADLL